MGFEENKARYKIGSYEIIDDFPKNRNFMFRNFIVVDKKFTGRLVRKISEYYKNK